MASAYTPGLKIVSKTLVEKDRKLPLKGEIKVKKGDKVTAETVVAAPCATVCPKFKTARSPLSFSS